MSIQKNSVVTFHYTLKDDAGTVIDSSDGGDPLAYIHGHGSLVAGLERELTGKAAGDKLQVKITPADGYGEHDAAMIQRIPRRQLKGISKIYVGMKLQTQTAAGPRELTVTQILGDTVTVDGNHPLAGKNLNFAIDITDVREATAEELEHGHVHGAHGHHH
jgi:FKBP-type peptidyl-prolyl cis-trans isomerase SlyD